MKRDTAAHPNLRPALLLTAAVLVVLAVTVVVVVKARSGSTLDLTGKWTAQDGVVTVNLTLSGNNDNLSGLLTTKNAPLPIKGTVTAKVTGTTALVHLHALGQNLAAHCNVSSTRMVCTGTGGNTTLTLTFTRP
jgi:hypothetical protein